MNGLNDDIVKAVIEETVNFCLRLVENIVNENRASCTTTFCGNDSTVKALAKVKSNGDILSTIKTFLLKLGVRSASERDLVQIENTVESELVRMLLPDIKKEKELSIVDNRELSEVNKIRQSIGAPSFLDFSSAPSSDLPSGVNIEAPTYVTVEGAKDFRIVKDPSGKAVQIEIGNLKKSADEIKIDQACKVGFAGKVIKKDSKLIGYCQEKRGGF